MRDHEIRELVNQLRDVAIKYHGAGQLREQIARTVRAAIIQAQANDDGEPTDDERIMAIEGIHNCERCGDQGWIVGEMGITRCACGQAGNSPVHSDRFPEQSSGSPAQSPIDHGYRPECECSGCQATARICAELAGNSPVIPDGWTGNDKANAALMMLDRIETADPVDDDRIDGIKRIVRELAAAPQPQNAPQNIPEIIPNELIAAVNRLLDSNGSRGCYSAIRCYDARAEVERLLAAAPQEVKGE